MAAGVYGATPVKRVRRTRAELDAVDAAIITAVAVDRPVSLRGVFYRVVSAGAVEKTEQGYDLIGRQLQKLRQSGVISYWDIATAPGPPFGRAPMAASIRCWRTPRHRTAGRCGTIRPPR